VPPAQLGFRLLEAAPVHRLLDAVRHAAALAFAAIAGNGVIVMLSFGMRA
jgi:hypothetical protein